MCWRVLLRTRAANRRPAESSGSTRSVRHEEMACECSSDVIALTPTRGGRLVWRHAKPTKCVFAVPC
jgi:hypothetical protein